MIIKQILFLMCVFSLAWAERGWAKVYKLTSQNQKTEAVQMRDPIMPGQAIEEAKIEFDEKVEASEKTVEPARTPKKLKTTVEKRKRLPRKLPKHTKTQEAPEERPGQLSFSTYAIGGRLDQSRVEFTLEPLPLPTSEEPVQIDYKQKLREMSSQKELGL